MKLALMCFVFSLAFVSANAEVKDGKIYYVHLEPTKYQLASGKFATAEIDVGFLSKLDADTASKDTPALKKTIEYAIAESKADPSTRKGKFVLAAEAASRLQDSGVKAQTL
ncbi:MAG: hypothetical protein ACXVCY_11885, partial [Pseudobdellovibrionaceae bacterium]